MWWDMVEEVESCEVKGRELFEVFIGGTIPCRVLMRSLKGGRHLHPTNVVGLNTWIWQETLGHEEMNPLTLGYGENKGSLHFILGAFEAPMAMAHRYRKLLVIVVKD